MPSSQKIESFLANQSSLKLAVTISAKFSPLLQDLLANYDTAESMRMPPSNMIPQNAQENVLVVYACCHLFDNINVTMLKTLGAEIL
jgi:hypothetical protein